MSPARDGGGADPAMRARRALERGATSLSIAVARSLHGRWQRMPAARRTKIEKIADDVKERALDMRGEPDQAVAGQELQVASEKLADAMVQSAQADPDVSAVQVSDLRADLARELERLAEGDIRASRGSDGAADTARRGERQA
jgi:hypothetical protein